MKRLDPLLFDSSIRFKYPETYQYVYSLVLLKKDENSLDICEKSLVIIDLLNEVDPDLVFDEMSDKDRKDFLHWHSFQINNPHAEPQKKFTAAMLNFYWRVLKPVINTIFEAADEELCYECNIVSDMDDWRNADNVERQKSFDTHFYL